MRMKFVRLLLINRNRAVYLEQSRVLFVGIYRNDKYCGIGISRNGIYLINDYCPIEDRMTIA